MHMTMLALVLILSLSIARGDVIWDHVDALIGGFARLPNVSFSAGDARGRLHVYEKGSTTMQTPQFLASSSKFPAALAIAGAVNEGRLSFAAKAHEVFPWWTSDPSDRRSEVTLHHLLTFTSGLVLSDPGTGNIQCLNVSNPSAVKTLPEECAREIYDRGPWQAAPGTAWSYHSLHLQVAGAMAAKASSLTLPQLLQKHLIGKLNLTDSFWLTDLRNPTPQPDPNPHLAAFLISTGDDYEKILQAVLTYSLVPKAIVDVMEEDAYRYYPELRPASNAKDMSLQFYGHYSMCTYFECLGPWTESCYSAGVHADPGAFGYWPLINRRKGYYMQLVLSNQEVLPRWALRIPGVAETAAALPAQCLAPIRFAIQPWVEAALGKNITDPHYQLPWPLAAECDLATPAPAFGHARHQLSDLLGGQQLPGLFGGPLGQGLPEIYI